MKITLLLILSLALTAAEHAEIPYDLLYNLGNKYGEDSIRLFQSKPSDDFTMDICDGDGVVENVVNHSSRFFKFSLNKKHYGKGYKFVTNQPKGSMVLQVITEKVDLNQMVDEKGLCMVDQFKKYYDLNLEVTKDLASSVGKSSKVSGVMLQIRSSNHKQFSVKFGEQMYTTTNGSMVIELLNEHFGKGLNFQFNPFDLKFDN